MDESQEVDPEIKKIDIRRFLIIPPEVESDAIKEEVEKTGFELNFVSGSKVHATLDKFNIPFDQKDEFLEGVYSAKETIKDLQIQTLEDGKGKIKIDTRLSSLLSTFFVELNRKCPLDYNRVFFVLESILADLYKHDVKGVEFLDERTLDYMAKATVSKKLKDAELNLDKALVSMLIQIRKLAILWLYDTLSLNFYNLTIDREDVGKIQNRDGISLNEIIYEKVPISLSGQRLGKSRRINLYFSDIESTMITFNLGRKTQNKIVPLMFSIFVDSASLKFRWEYTNILQEAMRRSYNQTTNDLRNLELDYDKLDMKDLLLIREMGNRSYDFFYQVLNKARNSIYAENNMIKRHYRTTFTKNLTRFLGGAISSDIKKHYPLSYFEALDHLVERYDKMTESIQETRLVMKKKMNELIEAKEKENPKLYKKAYKEFKEIIYTLLPKISGEMWGKTLDQFSIKADEK